MKITWKSLASLLCYALGTIGWCYVGGFLILTRPVKGLILAHLAGELSVGKLLIAFGQSFLYLSLAGGVWCIGYILSDHFKKEE